MITFLASIFVLVIGICFISLFIYNAIELGGGGGPYFPIILNYIFAAILFIATMAFLRLVVEGPTPVYERDDYRQGVLDAYNGIAKIDTTNIERLEVTITNE